MTIEPSNRSLVSIKAKIISVFLHVFLLGAVLWPNSSQSVPKISELSVSVEFEQDIISDPAIVNDPFNQAVADPSAGSNPTDSSVTGPHTPNTLDSLIPLQQLVFVPDTTPPLLPDTTETREPDPVNPLTSYELPAVKPAPIKPVAQRLPLPPNFPPGKPVSEKPLATKPLATTSRNIPNFVPIKPIAGVSSPANPNASGNNLNRHKPVSLEEQKLIMQQIHQNWSTDNGGRNYDNFQVVIRVQLRPDGTIFNLKSQLDPAFGNDSYYATFVRNAENAVWKTTKIIFPKERYQDFKELELVFSP
jgi:hypothetical protein